MTLSSLASARRGVGGSKRRARLGTEQSSELRERAATPSSFDRVPGSSERARARRGPTIGELLRPAAGERKRGGSLDARDGRLDSLRGLTDLVHVQPLKEGIAGGGLVQQKRRHGVVVRAVVGRAFRSDAPCRRRFLSAAVAVPPADFLANFLSDVRFQRGISTDDVRDFDPKFTDRFTA